MKKNLKEHHEGTFGKDESYETFVNEIKQWQKALCNSVYKLFKFILQS